jgi:Zn-finger nucleic acid-binding protein
MNPAHHTGELAFCDDTRPALLCAVCDEAMQPLRLFEIAAARCATHGVWFDKDQLAHVLLRSVQQPAPPANANKQADVAAADGAIGVASASVEVAASGVLDVIGGVAEAAVDAIADVVSSVL